MTEKNMYPQEDQEMSLEDRLFRNLRGMAHQMQHRADAKGGQGRILGILLRRERMTQRDLQALLGIQAGSLSEVLAKLEAAGLISRTPNEEDRRGMELALTQEGRRVAQEREAERRQGRQELFGALSQEEKATLAELLEKLNGDWRSRFGKGEGRCGGGHGRQGGGGGPSCRQGGQGCHGERGEPHGPGCHGKHGKHQGHGQHGGQGEHHRQGKNATPGLPEDRP